MTDNTVPVLEGQRLFLQLPNGAFIKVDTDQGNGNGQWVVEHLDPSGEFVAGLQIEID